MKLDYRLALDLGTNSIGWCVYQLSPDVAATDESERWRISGIQRMGVRIFSDGRNPKDLASLAASRRLARQQRRRRDRALKRKQRLLQALVKFGLMPDDDAARKALVNLDPYDLRERALNEELPLHHLGRAIFHLARKRGFRSGRKDFNTDDSETGKIKGGIERLRSKLVEAGCRTVGEYLARLHKERAPVLARPGVDGEYPIYLARELVSEEFDRLWQAQSQWHVHELSEDARTAIRDIILFQRPLRPVMPGKCLFEREEDRALLAHPLSQKFRILQELANLRIDLSAIDKRPLTLAERNRVLGILLADESQLDSTKQLTWARLRKVLELPKGTPFNLDIQGRRGLKADSVSIALTKPEALGAEWAKWAVEKQDRFLQALRRVDRFEDLGPKLGEAGFALQERQLAAVFACAARMPDDFGQVSLKALAKIVPALEAEVIHYDEAVKRAGYQSHSDFYDGVIHDSLPYYGERLQGYVQPRDLQGASEDERQWGRIANPTVHVALNQLRRVVNGIVRRYGNPREVIIEVARELGLSGQNRRKLTRQQEENRANNERLGTQLEELGQPNNRQNRQRLQLFLELTEGHPLDAECVYTGERIGLAALFSGEVDIDHILPFSRSLDDGMGNKLLCIRRANRDKGQRTPFEAFGSSPPGYSWPHIKERAERLVPKKARRFSESALEDFLAGRSFLDRHLTDTAYFSRVARQYLVAICPPNRVWVSTGKLTAMLRARWGFNRLLSGASVKDRTDHRHHAVDAAVIGACDRRIIRAIATAARRAESHGEVRILEGVEPPWPQFFDEVHDRIGKIVVSHKPDHGTGGALHNETAYGLVAGPDKAGRHAVSHSVPLLSLKKLSDLEDLADRGELRSALVKVFAAAEKGSRLKSALQEFSERTGVRRVRLVQPLTVVEIPNPHRAKSKYVKPDSNFCYEVVRAKGGRWSGYAVTRFHANQKGNLSSKCGIDGSPLVMRLHINDTIRAERSVGSDGLFRVVKVSDGTVALAPIREAGNLKDRHEDPRDPFRYWLASPTSLRNARARIVGVDELGYVNDPGFRE